eukprot:7205043-Ditylum_brightwellii.AAC.1
MTNAVEFAAKKVPCVEEGTMTEAVLIVEIGTMTIQVDTAELGIITDVEEVKPLTIQIIRLVSSTAWTTELVSS